MITGVNSNNMNTRKYIVVVVVIAESLSDIAVGIWTPDHMVDKLTSASIVLPQINILLRIIW